MHTVPNPCWYTRHQKSVHSCCSQTLHFITKLQILTQLGNILPSLTSLANKICYKKDSPPEAQLKFFIIIQPKEININGGHFTKKYIPYLLVDKTVKQKMNLILSFTKLIQQRSTL